MRSKISPSRIAGFVLMKGPGNFWSVRGYLYKEAYAYSPLRTATSLLLVPLSTSFTVVSVSP